MGIVARSAGVKLAPGAGHQLGQLLALRQRRRWIAVTYPQHHPAVGEVAQLVGHPADNNIALGGGYPPMLVEDRDRLVVRVSATHRPRPVSARR